MDKIKKLIELAGKLPKGLKSDWEGTNHYELTTSEKEYWWLILSETADCNTEDGKRLGLLLDIAQALKEAEEELKKATHR